MKIIHLINILSLLLLSTGLNAASLLYENTFNTFSEPDTETNSINGMQCLGNCPQSTISGNNGNAMTFVLEKTEENPEQTMAYFKKSRGLLEPDKEYWIGFTFNLADWAEDAFIEPAGFELYPIPGEWSAQCRLGNPYFNAPLYIYSQNHSIHFRSFRSPNPFYSIPVEQGKWISLVVNVKMSSSNDGFIEFFVDGASIGRIVGKNTPETDNCGNPMRGASIRLGTMKQVWTTNKLSTADRREVIVDDFKLAEGTNGYSLVHTSANNDTGSGGNSEIVETSNLVGDNFSTFKPSLWTFEDSVGDAGAEVDRNRLYISIPEGMQHDLWLDKLNAPRMMQSANNANVTVETKIESPMGLSHLAAGLLFQQDDDDLARFDVYHDGNNLYTLAVTFVDGAMTVHSRKLIEEHYPIYLRVSRQGTLFNFDYSYDHSTWFDAAQVMHRMNTRKVGLFAANAVNNPAYEAVFGYFAVNGQGIDLPGPGELADETILVTDNFQRLKTNVWDLYNPLGDGSIEVNDEKLLIAVPENSAHDLWREVMDVPRVMQKANDALFSIETKIESPMTEAFQIAGFIIEDKINKAIRADIYYDGQNLNLFSASIRDKGVNISNNFIIPNQFPIYLRIERLNNLDWSFDYSYDGVQWEHGSQFSFVLAVDKVGLFTGNSANTDSIPSYSGVFDYFVVNGETGDLTPPEINNLTTSATATSITLSWETNEPASTQAKLWLPDGSYQEQIGDDKLVTSHVVTFSRLTPETTYSFYVSSADNAFNVTTSPDSTVMTETEVVQ